MATRRWLAIVLAVSFNAAAAQGDTAAPNQALTTGSAGLKGLVVGVASGTKVRFVATCQNGAWICAAVHTSDGLTAGHCVNGSTGQRWSYP